MYKRLAAEADGLLSAIILRLDFRSLSSVCLSLFRFFNLSSPFPSFVSLNADLSHNWNSAI